MPIETVLEYNAVNTDPNAHKKKKVIIKIAQILAIIFAVFAVFIALYTPVSGEEDPAIGQILIYMVFFLILAISMIAFYILLGRYRNSMNPEYDYIIIGTKLRIVKVLNQVKRKLLVELDVKSISAMGKITQEEGLKRYMADPRTKKKYAIADLDAEAKQYFLFYSFADERTLLFCEMSDEFFLALKRAIGRDIMVKK